MPQRDRIDSLDILRGLAILGILLMNLPGFGTYYVAFFGNAPLAGWTPADQLAWKGLEIFAEGTQRGLLQLLPLPGQPCQLYQADGNDKS